MYQHYLNPFLIKQQLKSVDLSPKWFFWMSKPPFHHIFPFSNLQSLPVAIPEIFAQTQVSYYWQLIHWPTQNERNKILVHIS